MHNFQRAIMSHAGACSDPKDSDGPQAADKVGMDLMKRGNSALDAVVKAVRHLEDDPRFNAGTGSQIRADGRTIQLDASCMSSDGKFGAVACVEGVKNPIDLAEGILLYSDNILLVGEGARGFANEHNIRIEPLTIHDLKHSQVNREKPSCDTVGAVAFDGKIFSAALSSGGLQNSANGRVGDVPLPGCGLFCGPIGAIACTGDGEFIALKILAREVYSWLEEGASPEEAAQKSADLFGESVDVGLIILTKNSFASYARNSMACSHHMEFN